MVERAARVLALLIAGLWIVTGAHAAEGPFAHWAAIVVAGDHEDSDGNSTEGFDNARWLAVAPNGDVFLAEPTANKVTLLRDANGDGAVDIDDLLLVINHWS